MSRSEAANITMTVTTAARYANPVPWVGSSPSTVSPQINGPATAAARDESSMRLKKRPASSSGTSDSSMGRSAVGTAPKINPMNSPTIQNARWVGTTIMAMSRMIQQTIEAMRVRLAPWRSTSRPAM
jgi:hypothetical protein